MEKSKKIVIFLLFILLIILLPSASKAASIGKVRRIRATNNTKTTITIMWDKVANANYYQIYMYNDRSRKYEYYKTTNNTKYTAKGLNTAKKYKFKARAVKRVGNRKYHGRYSGTLITGTCPRKVQNLKISSQIGGTINLTWDSVLKATGYKIYVCKDGTNSYTYYGNSRTTSFAILNLEVGQKYKIRVRAYKKVGDMKFHGVYSSSVTATIGLDQVKNLRINSSTTLAWDYVSNAQGYEIYKYNISNSNWEYYGETLNLTMQIQNSNSTDIYKVRSYVTINNSRYYGAYSAIISTKQGIDVSKYQADIDWSKLEKYGITFAVIRSGYRGYETGKIAEDKYFKKNIQEATKLGLTVGIYFYSYAITEEEAIEEVDWCANKLKEYGVESKCKFIAYDFEEYRKSGRRAANMTKNQLNKIGIAFLKEVNSKGYTPVLYANKYYLTNYFDVNEITEQVPNTKIWLAHYTPDGKITDYKGNYSIWQYTSEGLVDGISGNVDLNIVYF